MRMGCETDGEEVFRLVLKINIFLKFYFTGVHVKALETYKQVFDILGPEKLAQLLYLFAIGLFPLMDHCGIKVLYFTTLLLGY